MLRNNKIIIILIISFLLLVSLFLIFIIKEKIAQVDVGLAQVEKEDPGDNIEVQLALAGIKNSLGADFTDQGSVDFEWRYRDNEELRSINVAGLGIIINEDLSGIRALRNYFKERGYVLEASNNVYDVDNASLGYYKDGLACLIAFTNSQNDSEQLSSSSRDSLYDATVKCGSLSEQDSLRIIPVEENESQMDEEHEAVAIAKAHIGRLADYIENQGGVINILSIKKMDCPGCWNLEVSFEIDDLDSLGARKLLQGELQLNDWVVAVDNIRFPIKILESQAACLAIGGLATGTVMAMTCPEKYEIAGKLGANPESPLCCQLKKAE